MVAVPAPTTVFLLGLVGEPLCPPLYPDPDMAQVGERAFEILIRPPRSTLSGPRNLPSKTGAVGR